MEHGTWELGRGRLETARSMKRIAGIQLPLMQKNGTPTGIKPAPRKKGPIKKPPDKPLPMPDVD